MQNKKFIAAFVLTAATAGIAFDASAQLTTYYAKDFDRSATKQTWNFYSYHYAPENAKFQGRTFWNNPRSGVEDGANIDGKANPEIVTLTNGATVARFKLHTHSKHRLPDKTMGFEGVEMYRDVANLKPLGGNFASIARAKIQITQAAPGGADFGFYAVTPGDANTRDEIDFEFLSSQLPRSLWLNIYKNGRQLSQQYTDPKKLALTSISFSPAANFNVYTIRYSDDAVNWHINDVTAPNTNDTKTAQQNVPIKSEYKFVPNNDLSVHVNAWVPDLDWTEANSQSLQPSANGTPYSATNPGGYKTYYFDVSWLQTGKGGHSRVVGKTKP